MHENNNIIPQRGTFVISLDFELFWGVRDKRTIQNYGQNILAVREIIPKLLLIFKEFNIHATFAVVGFLFFDNKINLLSGLPNKQPSYNNSNFSPYNGYVQNKTGKNESSDPYHYAKSLIQLIQKERIHEIGSHTFSHYYCLEEGQTKEQFADDLLTAKKVAREMNIELKSLIFPRNQFNNDYLSVVKEMGFASFRGNEEHWIYKARNGEELNLLQRFLRLIDSYINISGKHCYSYNSLRTNPALLNIAASRFLYPYNYRLYFLEWLKIRRIKNAMTYAAKKKEVFHLWWHPHNFGSYQKENFTGLRQILNHYKKLNKQYEFASLSMQELSDKITNNEY
jgi:peptidoglycan/xylan/chitin deacetylase (PgdA/CDA1 family)